MSFLRSTPRFLKARQVLLGATVFAVSACAGSPAAESVPIPIPPTPTVSSQVSPQPDGSAPSAMEGVTISIAEGSIARYLVNEQLADRDLPNDAIGETSDISGQIVLDETGNVIAGQSTITVGLRTLKSNKNRRDTFLRRNSLESNKFPEAELVINQVIGLPWPLPESGTHRFEISSDMTIRGITKPITWRVDADLTPSSIDGTARTEFTFDDFGMSKPSLLFILSVNDTIRLELDMVGEIKTTG